MAKAKAVLDASWDPYRGYCFPNAETYPHQWLWDSCFHAIAWGAVGDARGLRELHSVFAAQLGNGFVPHMRYAGETMDRGPLDFASSFTQPPIYAHAARFLSERGFSIDRALLAHIELALDYLWSSRMTEGGLLFVAHPWESGADDSPRWDGWIGSSEWEREQWTMFDIEALYATEYDDMGAASWSARFVATPAAFNALAAHAAAEFGLLTGNDEWTTRARTLAAAIDASMWNESEGLWSDIAIVGGDGEHLSVPTLDGVLPALVTEDGARADRAVSQLGASDRFAAPFGLSYVAKNHASYRPSDYWRGSAWMQMNYLARLAAIRWDRLDIADAIAELSRKSVIAADFAEHWNPETGHGRGACPQTWSTVVVAMT